jgi:hypothetical protein
MAGAVMVCQWHMLHSAVLCGPNGRRLDAASQSAGWLPSFNLPSVLLVPPVVESVVLLSVLYGVILFLMLCGVIVMLCYGDGITSLKTTKSLPYEGSCPQIMARGLHLCRL